MELLSSTAPPLRYHPSPQCLSSNTFLTMSSTKTETNQLEAMQQLIESYAQLFKNGQRSPILRRPSEYGMPTKTFFFLRWMARYCNAGSSLPLSPKSSSLPITP